VFNATAAAAAVAVTARASTTYAQVSVRCRSLGYHRLSINRLITRVDLITHFTLRLSDISQNRAAIQNWIAALPRYQGRVTPAQQNVDIDIINVPIMK